MLFPTDLFLSFSNHFFFVLSLFLCTSFWNYSFWSAFFLSLFSVSFRLCKRYNKNLNISSSSAFASCNFSKRSKWFLYDPYTPGSRWVCIGAYNYEIEVHLHFTVAVLTLENQKLYSAPRQSLELIFVKFFSLLKIEICICFNLGDLRLVICIAGHQHPEN